mmetsp:Transcript_25699/g.62440  ORF Transcript_25699/g.62440 Transcript_25699/m.62440 type:complete len:258 (-) Transcript_25699:206-979(-)
MLLRVRRGASRGRRLAVSRAHEVPGRWRGQPHAHAERGRGLRGDPQTAPGALHGRQDEVRAGAGGTTANHRGPARVRDLLAQYSPQQNAPWALLLKPWFGQHRRIQRMEYRLGRRCPSPCLPLPSLPSISQPAAARPPSPFRGSVPIPGPHKGRGVLAVVLRNVGQPRAHCDGRSRRDGGGHGRCTAGLSTPSPQHAQVPTLLPVLRRAPPPRSSTASSPHWRPTPRCAYASSSPLCPGIAWPRSMRQAAPCGRTST